MILDTDVVIDLLRARPQARAWMHALPERPAISGMAALEVLFGAQDRTELRNVEAYLQPFAIYWPVEADAQAAGRLAMYNLSDGIDIIDAMTAAIALRHKLTVVTFNVKHFRSIPGLDTVQPYDRT